MIEYTVSGNADADLERVCGLIDSTIVQMFDETSKIVLEANKEMTVRFGGKSASSPPSGRSTVYKWGKFVSDYNKIYSIDLSSLPAWATIERKGDDMKETPANMGQDSFVSFMYGITGFVKTTRKAEQGASYEYSGILYNALRLSHQNYVNNPLYDTGVSGIKMPSRIGQGHVGAAELDDYFTIMNGDIQELNLKIDKELPDADKNSSIVNKENVIKDLKTKILAKDPNANVIIAIPEISG